MIKKIQQELENYISESVEITPGYTFNQNKLCRRILLYKNGIYPTGKYDSQGNYKYYFDVISPRVDSEVKNIDFDTKDIVLFSDAGNDAGRLLISNARLKSFLRETGEAAKLNEAVERGSEWGNVVWKKIKGGYKLMELNKIYVLNTIAESLEDSDVIEMEIMTASDLRKKIDVWLKVEDLITLGSAKGRKKASEFYIYERNGEVSEREYNEVKGQKGGDENKFYLAKVIVGGIDKDKPTHLLFCDYLNKKPYKEYHRGKYSGRWMRVGVYEMLFDIQTRANEIGNQIARGLEWASKKIFRSSDKIFAQNILTDLQNGDIVKSTDLQAIDTRMEGFDQLIADWNRLMQIADKLANSFEVVTGESLPSGTPFKLGDMLNVNANKLFDFIREKLGIAFQEVIQEWILPDLLKDLKAKDVLKLTADSGFLERYYAMVIEDWYLSNLLAFPPHSGEEALELKKIKFEELLKNKEAVVTLEKDMWENFKPRVFVNIVGENYALDAEL